MPSTFSLLSRPLLLVLRASVVVLVLVCGTARAQQPGDLVITEWLTNPGGTISDANGEWFELFNTTNRPIDLKDWAVRDSAASGLRPLHIIASSVIVPAYGFVVLGNTTNTTNNGGVPVDYAYGSAMAFANSLDGLVLLSPDSTVIDRAYYASAAISAQNGISRELLDVRFDNRSMDSPSWADALTTSVYGPGGRGTPGAAGQTFLPPPVLSTTAVTSAVAGYRLVAPPMRGATVGTLAELNLVQGLVDEFPNAEGPNLFSGYSGNGAATYGGFVAPTSTSTSLPPGRGVLWYMYDEGGPPEDDTLGFSRRATLPLTLQTTGYPVTGDAATTFSAAERAGATDQFYLLGNPFDGSFDLSGLTASSGTLSEVVQLYVPGSGYVVRTRVPGVSDGDASDDVAVWQGFFAEFFAPPSLPVTLTYADAARTATEPPYVGRTAGASTYRRVGLRLSGVTASGAATNDEAAVLYVSADATEGWDAFDASKLAPLSAPSATLALRGVDATGQTKALAQRSLPDNLAGPVAVPVTFSATEAGRYTVSVSTFEHVPATWEVRLSDLDAGTETALSPGTSYTFESGPGAHDARFVLTVVPGAVTAGESLGVGVGYTLSSVSPNPSRHGAQAVVSVRETQPVRAEVYDLLGRRVSVAFEGTLAAGSSHTIRVGAGLLSAGAYVLRVSGAEFSDARVFHVAR